jgi:hypothetical protein
MCHVDDVETYRQDAIIASVPDSDAISDMIRASVRRTELLRQLAKFARRRAKLMLTDLPSVVAASCPCPPPPPPKPVRVSASQS